MELCLRFCLHLPIRWMMPTSGIVPIPCADAAEGMVQLPSNLKRRSKLSGALACRAARRKVLQHVALGHGSRVVQRKSPPLVGFTSLPVAFLLSTASTTSSTMSKEEVTSPSPPFGKSTPPARRSPRVETQVVPVIQDRSWQCHLCTYEQDLVPGSRACIMCHSTRRRLVHCAPWCVVKSKLVHRKRGGGKSGCPNCRLGDRCKACWLACLEKCIDDI
jgi:hypothetical protein